MSTLGNSAERKHQLLHNPGLHPNHFALAISIYVADIGYMIHKIQNALRIFIVTMSTLVNTHGMGP
jgi:hypothetical protein